MKRTKYYCRLMRPVFMHATFTVRATSEEAAARVAVEQAEQLSEGDWAVLEAEQEPPVVEVVLPEDDANSDSEADVLKYLNEEPHAYALLQADLEGGEGSFIAPIWLKRQPALAVADITQDWSDALSDISEEGTEAFYAWLTRQVRPTNVVDFFAERDRLRGKARH